MKDEGLLRNQKQSLSNRIAGKFIVLDGPDGCGKSTQIQLLVEHLSAVGVEAVTVRDPGDTKIGDAIRRILLGVDHEHRDIRCELMLFMASRAQLIAEKIIPAMQKGRTVIGDRYVSSSCAYQGASGEISIDQILKIAGVATRDTWPELTIVLDVPSETGLKRIGTHRLQEHDAMERRGLAYHRNVREIYIDLGKFYPRPVVVVDANETIQKVHERIVETLISVDY